MRAPREYNLCSVKKLAITIGLAVGIAATFLPSLASADCGALGWTMKDIAAMRRGNGINQHVSRRTLRATALEMYHMHREEANLEAGL
jgi:hypothetical protein